MQSAAAGDLPGPASSSESVRRNVISDGKRKPIWIIALAIILPFVGAGLAAWNPNQSWLNGSDQTSSPAGPLLSPAALSILVQSDPPGATAWVNGQPLGVTPFRMTHAGTFDVAIRLTMDGYQTLDRILPASQLASLPEVRLSLQQRGRVEPVGVTQTAAGSESSPCGAGHVVVVVGRPDIPAVRECAMELIDLLPPTNTFSVVLLNHRGEPYCIDGLGGLATPEHKVRAFDFVHALRTTAQAPNAKPATPDDWTDGACILLIGGEPADVVRLRQAVGPVTPYRCTDP